MLSTNKLSSLINLRESWHFSIAMFPEEMSGLFIYQGVLTSDDVCSALYIQDEDDVDPENEIVFNFLLRHIDTLSEEDMEL